MNARNFVVAAVLSLLFAVPAVAQSPNGGFAALQGLDAQALSAEEMQAISGQLNAYDIAAALLARAATVEHPRLKALLVNAADFYLTNAERLNAFYDKIGKLTPCTSSLCP